MTKYLDFFEGVYYINLAKRTDRKDLFEKRAAELGINATRFEAIVPQPEYVKMLYEGHEDITRAQKIGCTLSHQGVILEAREKGLKNVLIFEDDCVFLEGFNEKLSLSVRELEHFEWDLLYMGGEPNNYMHQVSENLYMMKNSGGIYTTHCYAVNERFYDRMLDFEANKVGVIDTVLLNMPNKKLFATKELLAIQDTTYSDLWLNMTNSQNTIINGWIKYISNGIKLDS
jgi:GR25 family glycosyltransferase involved in LPS biosynthesis